MHTDEAIKSLRGLYKRISPTKRVWIVKARQRGANKVRTITIGRLDVMPLSEAKRVASPLLAKLSSGINPSEERRVALREAEIQRTVEEARSITLAEVIDRHFELATLKPKTLRDQIGSLKRNFSDWYPKPIRSINREMVLDRFQSIRKRVTAARETRDQARVSNSGKPSKFSKSTGLGEAQKAFRYLNSIFDAVMNDEIGGEALIPRNPILVLKEKKLRKQLPARTTYLDETQVRKLVEHLNITYHDHYKGKIRVDDADAIRLYLFTATRLDEARLLRWEDVDIEKKVFRIVNPKNNKTHTLPMTDSISGLFQRRRALSSLSDFVFPSPRDVSRPNSFSRTFDRVSAEVGFQVLSHDLRRTFATHASSIGFDVLRIGEALNHSKQGVTAGYIQSTSDSLRITLETVEKLLLGDFEANAAGIVRPNESSENTTEGQYDEEFANLEAL